MKVIALEEAERALAEQMAYEARIEYGGRQRAEDYLLIAKAYFQNCPVIETEPNSCKYWDSESHFCALRRPQAEPVRRGRWIYKDDDAFAGEYACSNCNGRAEVDLYGQWILSKFCSNCGSRMMSREKAIRHIKNAINVPNNLGLTVIDIESLHEALTWTEPVGHGRWVWSALGVACSVCGCKLQTTGIPRFCSNCGAKMDGGEEQWNK